MLETLVSHHNIDPAFLELPLSFYERMEDREQAYCVPWTVTRSATSYGK